MAFTKGFQLRLPRPTTFCGLMSLQTGTEMIALSLLFNKMTGLYGLLAIFTGYHLSIAQLSLYVYSVVALGILAYCSPHIRKQTPFQNLAFAWLYIIDTAVNTAYTTLFAVSWFLALEQVGPKQSEPTETDEPPMGGFLGAVDTTTSMTLIVIFTLIRVYFMFVVMAYARSVLLQYREGNEQDWDNESQSIENPFAAGMPEGDGWKGKVGRTLVSVGRTYWLPSLAERDEWARSMNSRFRGKAAVA
ncbi:putative Inositol phoshorylceramide synthase regulatory subunit kei1 [Seiridium unicorne]|uniref:Inositol phoshorylceramide synthase regulatory subunit kei1 n=1 Tax=Seiridium unicorne TaxID=138068 RepID=A0ABR2USR9_9PEZI